MNHNNLDAPPNVYRTTDIDHYGKLVINFTSNADGLIGEEFTSLEQVKEWLIYLYGVEQFKSWFPNGISELLPNGTVRYVNCDL